MQTKITRRLHGKGWMEREAWAGQNEGKWRSEVAAFQATGLTAAWAWQGEYGETAIPAPTWIRCLVGNGLFKELEAEKVWGTLGHQLCLVPMKRMWSCCYLVRGPGKTETNTCKSPSCYLSRNVEISPKQKRAQLCGRIFSLHTVWRSPQPLHALLGNLECRKNSQCLLHLILSPLPLMFWILGQINWLLGMLRKPSC